MRQYAHTTGIDVSRLIKVIKNHSVFLPHPFLSHHTPWSTSNHSSETLVTAEHAKTGVFSSTGNGGTHRFLFLFLFFSPQLSMLPFATTKPRLINQHINQALSTVHKTNPPKKTAFHPEASFENTGYTEFGVQPTLGLSSGAHQFKGQVKL